MGIYSYLTIASSCIAACYLLYFFIFRKLTFFSLNRYYLLLSIALSLLLPLIHIQIKQEAPLSNFRKIVQPLHQSQFEQSEDGLGGKALLATVDWTVIIADVYWTVTAVLIFRVLFSLLRIIYKGYHKGILKDDYRVVHNDDSANASFFHIIFVNDQYLSNAESEQIISHEKAHIKLGHSVDNVLLEFLKAVFWFNPFIYLLSNALHTLHEYEVDQALVQRYEPKEYASLLVKLSAPKAAGLFNKLSAYSLKSRVSMLFRKPSLAGYRIVYLLVPVLFVLLFGGFAVDRVSGKDGLKTNFILILDAGHGGVNSGARAFGLLEKDLALQLVRHIETEAKKHNIRTILSREADKIVYLRDRIKFQGNVFVSVHLNTAEKSMGNPSGIEVLVNKNAAYNSSVRLANSFLQSFGELQGIKTDHHLYDRGVYVLRENKLPAVLLEMGYISNKEDLEFITNAENQKKVAITFIQAIEQYRDALK